MGFFKKSSKDDDKGKDKKSKDDSKSKDKRKSKSEDKSKEKRKSKSDDKGKGDAPAKQTQPKKAPRIPLPEEFALNLGLHVDFPGSETLLPGHGVESSGPYPAAEATAVTPTAPEQNKEQGTTTQEGGEDDGYGYDLAMSGAIQVGGPGPSSQAPYYSTDHQLAAALQEHEERIAASDSVYSYPVDAPPGEFPSQPCYYSDEPPPVEKYQIRPPPPKFDPWAIGHKRKNKITQVKICQDCTEADSVVGPVIYVQALGMWLCNYCGNQRLHYGSQQAGQATQKFQGGGSNRSSKNCNGKGKS